MSEKLRNNGLGFSSFAAQGDCGFFRLSGNYSPGELADLITTSLSQARELEMHDVLVDITGVTGLKSPGPAYRRWVAKKWAETTGGAVRVAMVARREHICPRKTGLLIAAEHGLNAHICEAEAEAITWLIEKTSSVSTNP